VLSIRALSAATAAVLTLGCWAPRPLATTDSDDAPGARPRVATVVRVTGSDTMVNLVQAWAERFHAVRPDIAVYVAGGGSGVGVAGLTDRLVDIAAASREMTDNERGRAAARGAAPVEFTVALDALAIYVHRTNPLATIALADLAEIYGEDGRIRTWSQLHLRNAGCRNDAIVRIGRQSSSGTYAYFRAAVLGQQREYRMGSIDQSGSKDVVALVGTMPCAIGYSGSAYATAAVKAVGVRSRTGGGAVQPTAAATTDGSYPLARRLYFYTAGQPAGVTLAFIEWVLGPSGQRVAAEIGFVPAQVPAT
jgi:phosphate transport system substrate-binding protein